MFVLNVLNDANEWETVVQQFDSVEAAVAFFNAELSCFADYEVVEVQAA